MKNQTRRIRSKCSTWRYDHRLPLEQSRHVECQLPSLAVWVDRRSMDLLAASLILTGLPLRNPAFQLLLYIWRPLDRGVSPPFADQASSTLHHPVELQAHRVIPVPASTYPDVEGPGTENSTDR